MRVQHEAGNILDHRHPIRLARFWLAVLDNWNNRRGYVFTPRVALSSANQRRYAFMNPIIAQTLVATANRRRHFNNRRGYVLTEFFRHEKLRSVAGMLHEYHGVVQTSWGVGFCLYRQSESKTCLVCSVLELLNHGRLCEHREKRSSNRSWLVWYACGPW